MPGTSSIGGLISGLDTATLIQQLISISRKRIDVVVNNQTAQSNKLKAYQSFNTQLLDFKSKASTLKDSKTFNVFKSAISTNSTNFKASDLLSVLTTTDASPGTHTVQFTSSSQLAQARQLSSQSYSSTSTALNLSGDFVINGKAITVITTDTLADIATKINNANSGSNATGVTATILSVSSTDNRLILTSDNTGKDSFSILDASSGATNILQTLGLTNGSTTIKNSTSDGAKSDEFSNSETTIKSLLNLTNAQNGTVTIAGENIVIDLSSESLSTIAGNINTALTAASKGTASVVSTTTNGVTTFRIDISGTTSFTDSNNILETLGILEGQQSSVAEVHTASTANIKVSTGLAIDSGTTFDDIDTGGGLNNVQNNDTITISGTDHNGNSVSGTYTISNINTDTIQGLLTQIETVFGLTAGSATIDATGQIVITDDTAGDSQLSVDIITNNEGGGTLDFGVVSATTQGFTMQTTAGQDANVKIDGVAVTRSTNSIDDVISGVTIDLSRIENGTTVNLTVSRDTDSIKSSVNDFVSAYNGVIEFINDQFTFNEETESAGILSGETFLSSIKSIIQSTITSTISLLPGGSNALSLIGITSDVNGKLSLKDSDFLSAISSDFNAVKRMFIAEGTATNSEITFIGHNKNTIAGEYAVNITTVATQATVTGNILTNGIGAGNTETLTITDTATGRVATITLDGNAGQNGSSIDNIVNAINSELDIERTQTLVGSVANSKTTAAGGGVITSSTKFSEINTGGDASDLVNGDIISFTGTTRSGLSISGSYTISDVSTDTVQGFLSAIESAYSNSISATINSSGEIVLTDNTVGDSQLSIAITEPAGRNLDFGTVLTTNTGGITGKYAMEITASKDGSDQLVITHDSFGSAQGFTITEMNALTGTAGTFVGADVAGTINGEAATGVGQILTGDTGSTTSVGGLSINVASTTTGSKGNVKLTIGVGEEMYNDLDSFTDQFDGLLTIRMDGIQVTVDNLQDTIEGMEGRLALEQIKIENQFVQLEISLSRLQSISSFLTQQLGSLTKLLS
ncbi:MAG: flagellar filament capping protein FliD [Candidatus Scalinduaceae bacterium]